MSHPVPGHDYSEKHKEETHKEYAKRAKAGKSVKAPKSKALTKFKK